MKKKKSKIFLAVFILAASIFLTGCPTGDRDHDDDDDDYRYNNNSNRGKYYDNDDYDRDRRYGRDYDD